MRKKRRYIAFESIGGASASDVMLAVNSLRAGKPKPEQSMLKLVLYDPNSRKGLLRCGHMQVEETKAWMSNMSLRVLGVSGTIKAARRKFLVNSQKS